MEESIDNLVGFFKEEFDVKGTDLKMYSPLALAYIGDCIYDLTIRTMIVERGNAPVNKLHRTVSTYVKASAQMDLFYKIEKDLTEEEMAIYKRGRNAKSFTSAKNASIAEYRTATGVEALVGYLYLSGNLKRAVGLIKLGLQE